MELVFVCDKPVKKVVDLSRFGSNKTSFIFRHDIKRFMTNMIRGHCDMPFFIDYEKFKTAAKYGDSIKFLMYTMDQTFYEECWKSIKKQQGICRKRRLCFSRIKLEPMKYE